MKIPVQLPFLSGIFACCALCTIAMHLSSSFADPDVVLVGTAERDQRSFAHEPTEELVMQLRSASIANVAETAAPFGALAGRPEDLRNVFIRAIEYDDQILAVQLAYALRNANPKISTPISDAAAQLIAAQSVPIRLLAIESTGLIGLPTGDVVSQLLQASRHPDVRVRYRSVAAMGRLRTPPDIVLNGLSRSTDDESTIVASRAERSLESLRRYRTRTPPEAGNPSSIAAEIPKGKPKATQLNLAKQVKEVSQIDTLMADLKGSDDKIRAEAAMTIATVGSQDPRLLPGLEQNLRHSDERVRFSAFYALSQIGPTAVPILSRALSDEDPGIRAKAAHALRSISPTSPQIANALLPGLSDPNDGVRVQAASAVLTADPKHEEAFLTLIQALGSNHATLPVVSPALKTLNVQAAMPRLLQALQSEDPTIQRGAARALTAIGPGAVSAAPALETLLKDENESVRKSAEAALASILVVRADAER